MKWVHSTIEWIPFVTMFGSDCVILASAEASISVCSHPAHVSWHSCVDAWIPSSSATNTPADDANHLVFAIIMHDQWATWVPLQYLANKRFLITAWNYAHNNSPDTNPVCLFQHKPYSVLFVMIDISYYDIDSMIIWALPHAVQHLAMFHLQMFSLQAKTRIRIQCIWNQCAILQSDNLPQPTAMPVFPAGSKSSCGKQTGIIFLENWIGLRSLSNAMSWL